MSRKSSASLMIFITLVLAACSPASSITPQVYPTDTFNIPATETSTPTKTNTSVAPTITLVPTNTATAVPGDTPISTASNPSAPIPIPASGNYIDDRSTPSQVIVSFYNAINRHEYLRAYSYWSDPANSLGPFSDYASGYQDTASVDLVFG
jgi:hypothetical protein